MTQPSASQNDQYSPRIRFMLMFLNVGAVRENRSYDFVTKQERPHLKGYTL